MDPISVNLLVAAATGAGGEMGRQLWNSLRGLVRRDPADEIPETAAATGEGELAAFAAAPEDEERARLLSVALGRRADREPAFRADLARWRQEAQVLYTRDQGTTNVIAGGTQHGPVVQGRDFSTINFGDPGRE